MGILLLLKFPDYSAIRWVLNCGRGTNTKAELMGAWATLKLAIHLSIQRLQILGDSKVVIEYLSNRGRLQVCAIEGWKARIRDLIKSFDLVSFEHIYKNFNNKVLSFFSFYKKEPLNYKYDELLNSYYSKY